jgi:hypothetical protein
MADLLANGLHGDTFKDKRLVVDARGKALINVAGTQFVQDQKIVDLEAITPDDVDETFLAAVQSVQNAGRWNQTAWDAVVAQLAARTVQSSAVVDLTAGAITLTDVGGGNPGTPIALPAAIENAGVLADTGSANSGWQYSTDGMTVKNGDKIILQPNHSLLWPSTTNLESFQMAPGTGNWKDNAAGTGSIAPDAGWTFGRNQNLFFGSDVIRCVNSAANTNVLLFSGGEDAPSQSIRVNTVADLPAATSVASGSEYIVVNDGANSRPYIARGPLGSNAVAWS